MEYEIFLGPLEGLPNSRRSPQPSRKTNFSKHEISIFKNIFYGAISKYACLDPGPQHWTKCLGV
jgi:hypothetical protein